MKRYIYFFFVLLAFYGLTACNNLPENVTKVDHLPVIFPDYKDVTIPADIAPLNFNIVGRVDAVDVVLEGSKEGKIHSNGDYADFDIDEWHQLTQRNIGGNIRVTVCVEKDGKWTQYKDFFLHISPYRLDDYGVTYRLIPPGYEVGGEIGIYQRNIHNFDETAILEEKAVPGNCINCHTPNRTNPKMFTSQMRSEHGGTLVQIDGVQKWYNTKTDSTKAAGSYAYWHPKGRYIAYSTNDVRQSFFVGRHQPIEVFHNFGNIILFDTKTGELVLDNKLQTPDWLEIFPAFSADGKTMYYSTSKVCDVPTEYRKVKCSLVAIPFNAKNGTFGTKVDTLLNGPKTNSSYLHARPSYDGKWLMFTKCSRSNFSIVQPDADLWIMNLKTRQSWPLTGVNSPCTESYHNWSSNSRWFVFSSKRGDGIYTKLYFSSIDDKGHATKPFLLPQKNPWEYYHRLFKAYNVPDFTKTKVDFDVKEAQRQLKKDRIQVTIRK